MKVLNHREEFRKEGKKIKILFIFLSLSPFEIPFLSTASGGIGIRGRGPLRVSLSPQ